MATTRTEPPRTTSVSTRDGIDGAPARRRAAARSQPDDLTARFRAYRATGDRQLRDELVRDHLGLAHALAWRYRNRGEELDDLRQVAVVGLVKAIERFDPDRGVKFSSFGVPTILGELKRHFRDHGWTISVPRRLKVLRQQADRARQELEQRQERPPTVREVAAEVGEDVEDVLVAMEGLRDCYHPSSLEQRSRPDLPTGSEPESEQAVRHALVEDLLGRLEPRERRIVVLRFWEDLTQQEIADRVGVSQMHVSRLLRRSLAELR